MRIPRKASTTLCTALVTLAALAATATAATLEARPAGRIAMPSQGLVSFRSSIATTTCRLTLGGSLHSTIEKVAGTLMGFITEATVGEPAQCNEGIVISILLEPRSPWHIQYNSILGTLPSAVRGVLFIVKNIQWLYTIPTIFGTQTCLFAGDQGALLGVTGRNPYTTGLVTILSSAMPLNSAAGLNTSLCPSHEEVTATFSLTPQQTLTRT